MPVVPIRWAFFIMVWLTGVGRLMGFFYLCGHKERHSNLERVDVRQADLWGKNS